mmetsp:Transcript_9962/g.12947  ORF Transcript_9962/g.12947 Transcript_9962/m.12947 type:complete len:384 (-) Transcript_9962:63-1214(-)
MVRLGLALSSVLASFLSTAIAFTAQTRSNTKSFVSVSSNSCVNRNLNVRYNVPADISDWDTVKSAADREPPPSSFFVLQENSVKAAKLAIDQGERLIEVEYPPLPADVLESEDVSAYDVSKANVRLAVEFAKSFAVEYDMETAILVPDEAELAIALENYQNNRPFPKLQINSLLRNDDDDSEESASNEKGNLSFFQFLFGGNSGTVKPLKGTKMYIILTASAQELPDVEELYNLTRDDDAVICFYNLKLDVLRGDLGAPAFPGKDLQDRFLSRVKPVYYLRTRQYSRSIATPPFILNFQGCLFRSYPGQFQTLLDTGDGQYRRVKGNDIRPALGGFKEELIQELIDIGAIQEESKTLNFLRTGYKTTTWWEEEREEASMEWRT